MTSRCAILATPYRDVPAMQCPTTQTTFHYHKAIGPAFYSKSYAVRPCQHRHKSIQAALRCTDHVTAGDAALATVATFYARNR